MIRQYLKAERLYETQKIFVKLKKCYSEPAL